MESRRQPARRPPDNFRRPEAPDALLLLARPLLLVGLVVMAGRVAVAFFLHR